MPKNLKRYYGRKDLHFLTFSCYRRFPLLGSARARNVFLRILDEVRAKYGFLVVGYVVMPEHVHLLVGEPKSGTPSTVVHVLKLRVSRKLRAKHRGKVSAQMELRFREGGTELPRFWQRRVNVMRDRRAVNDFNVWSKKKVFEKLEYMHRNPVARGLVKHPKHWAWSSYSSYVRSGPYLIAIDLVV